jgi:heme exporter protein A
LVNPVNRFPRLRVEADGLACTRGGRAIFRDISFSIGAGGTLAVTGPNGAGKSSLLRIMAGLLDPSGGRLAIRAENGGDEDAEAPLHYFGHLDGLKPAMSLAENLRYWCRIYDRPAGSGALRAATGRLGLAHALDLPVGVFSAGQRRRAGLARIMLAPRPIWLLDEPTSALDKDGEAILGEVMAEHLEAGGVIVAATHLDLPVRADLKLEMAVPA